MAVQQLVERRRDTGEVPIPPGLAGLDRREPRDRTGPQPVLPPLVAPSRTLVRRRRIVLALGALVAAATLAAIGTGAAVAWAAVAFVMLAAGGYLAILHRNRCRATEREFAAVLGPNDADLSTVFGIRPVRPVTLPAHQPAGPGHQTLALMRFLLANVAGWALSPVVFALTLLLRETPRDATGQRWLANLQAAQTRLRDQSWRTLAISAATTASVTAAGTVTAMTGGAPASAATLTTSLPLTTAASSGTTLHYRVISGDTVGSIAQRFGTSIGAIIAANHLKDANLIFPGQVLNIPGATRAGDGGWGAPASRGGRVYRVVAGDTVSAIAERFGTSAGALIAANHLSDPNLIFPGQDLIVPGAGTAGTGATHAAPPPPAPSPSRATHDYRVVAGDTLGSIAARFGTTTAAIASANHLSNPNLIYVGQTLVLPGAGGSVPTAPAPDPAPTTAPATTGAATAVRVALAQVGKPYQWGGAGPGSFDCSGLVEYAWSHAGVSLPHYSVAQYQDTQRIGRAQLEPGDLVFYDTGGGAQPGHVTIYIGGGQIVTADSPGTVIRVEVVDWDGTPMGYGRVR